MAPRRFDSPRQVADHRCLHGGGVLMQIVQPEHHPAPAQPPKLEGRRRVMRPLQQDPAAQLRPRHLPGQACLPLPRRPQDAHAQRRMHRMCAAMRRRMDRNARPSVGIRAVSGVAPRHIGRSHVARHEVLAAQAPHPQQHIFRRQRPAPLPAQIHVREQRIQREEQRRPQHGGQHERSRYQATCQCRRRIRHP